MWHSFTKNVSTGGAYFETTLDDIHNGDHLTLAIGVDPHDQRFPPDGKITTVGEVIRIEPIRETNTADTHAVPRFGIGVKFLKKLKLSF